VALTQAQAIVVWDRWKAGDSSRLIARTVGCSPAVVRSELAKSGGIRPAPRRRDLAHLSTGEREEVSRGLAAGLSSRAIARQLGRSPSTISREIARNGGRHLYRASAAEVAAVERARRPKVSRLAADPLLLADVRGRLEEDWSPQQIAVRLKHRHPDQPPRWVSHETIYRSIYLASRRELGDRPSKHLRSGRSVRRPRKAGVADGRGRLRNMVSIHRRPAIMEDRVEVGHWEGDLVMGRRPSAVATLVERSTRFVRVVALPEGYKADAVRRALRDDLAQLHPSMRRSLTWDRGREMAEHQDLSVELGIEVFFCDRHSPWQRGTNENTNRLLRQYLAKTADLRSFSTRDLDDIAGRINTRPRRVLDWASAHDRYWPQVQGALRS